MGAKMVIENVKHRARRERITKQGDTYVTRSKSLSHYS